MAVALVEQRRRNGVVRPRKIIGDAIEFERGDAGLDLVDENVERFGREPPRLAHASKARRAVQRNHARSAAGLRFGIHIVDHRRHSGGSSQK